MNEKEFNILFEIYSSEDPIYLRELTRKTRMPYGTVQSIINRNRSLFETKISGKNSYLTFKKSSENKFLILQLEIEKTKRFLAKNPTFIPFVEKCSEINATIIIFGSFAKGKNTKKSDLDILVISDEDVSLPEHLCPVEIHIILVKTENLSDFMTQALYSEIKSNHLILSNFEFCLNKVLKCC